MRKIIIGIISTMVGSFAFAGDVERALRQIGPMPFLTVGAGGITLVIGAILGHLAISYGIALLAKKYEPSLHPAWSWIPVLNIYPLVKVSHQPLWWIAVILLGGIVPGVGPLIVLGAVIFIYYKLSVRTGRGAGTAALLVFFSVIMIPWLGLSVNKKDTKIAWILGICALLISFIGVALTGVGAVGGALKLNRTHRFMDKARDEVMREIQSNPSIREQMKNLEPKTDKADISKTDDEPKEVE